MKIYWAKTRTISLGGGKFTRELVTNSPYAPFEAEMEFWGKPPIYWQVTEFKQWWPLSWFRPLFCHEFRYDFSKDATTEKEYVCN